MPRKGQSERLSKLQKWILIRADEMPDERYVMPRKYIMVEYFNVRNGRFCVKHPHRNVPMWTKNSKKLNSIQASLGRCLRNLKDKGYIKIFFHHRTVPLSWFQSVGVQMSPKEHRGNYNARFMEMEKDEILGYLGQGIGSQGETEAYVKAISLTDKGRQRAKELLNVKK